MRLGDSVERPLFQTKVVFVGLTLRMCVIGFGDCGVRLDKKELCLGSGLMFLERARRVTRRVTLSANNMLRNAKYYI
jgi:hypothetical protein